METAEFARQIDFPSVENVVRQGVEHTFELQVMGLDRRPAAFGHPVGESEASAD